MATLGRRIASRLVVIDDEVRKTVLEVLERTPYYAGPETAAFEAELAGYCGVGRGVAANSGTSCLLLALLARGVGPGDEVIVPANTFVSVPECVLFVGATPVFTDVEPDGNISAGIVERHLTPRTRAVVPVHMFGHPVDMDPIMALARDRGLYVIEDAAHALGARYRGRRAGSLGHVGFFSFAGKSITVCGQAGMAVTDDAELASTMASLRVHGWNQKVGNVWHVAERLGLNLRTSELLSAIGRVHLRRLEEWTAARTRNAARYTARLRAGDAPVILPATRPDQEPGWLHYVIRAPRRDALRAFLLEQGVETGIHYPVPLYRQPAFASLAPKPSAFPITEAMAADMLTLPSHPWMTDDEVDIVADAVLAFYGR
ncbi:MAG: DegT/DnrJ/EryC1/StrS family aminotransferase [Armatimonadota bacterium]|nr:DegT/DnrJ/EryC1/StrS family aminotransferase [Armatimonadota bacterium]